MHFDVYAKLFSEDALPKKCAIVTDGDLKPSDADQALKGKMICPRPLTWARLKTITSASLPARPPLSVPSHSKAPSKCLPGRRTISAHQLLPHDYAKALAALAGDRSDAAEREAILAPLRKSVLNTAKRFGKARFAQIAAVISMRRRSSRNTSPTRRGG